MQLDNSKIILRSEFLSKIKESLSKKDWLQMESIASHWVRVDSENTQAMKWYARASVARNNIQKAAYAYGRLLDLQPENEEAKKFFHNFPSSIQTQPANTVEKLIPKNSVSSSQNYSIGPEKRRILSQKELELAKLYEDAELFVQASDRFMQSFEWLASQDSALGVARSLHKSRRSSEAQKFLRKQLENSGRWIEGRVLLGKILFESSYFVDAQKEFQLVLQLSQNHPEAMEYLQNLLSKPY